MLERVRIMQATYLVQSSVGDLALRSLSVEKQPEIQPEIQQVVNIQDDSDFNDENSQAK